MTSRVFRRPPALGRLRLAKLDDVAPILELVNESMSKNFRVSNPSDVVYLIENCVLCVCQLDVTEMIVGFLAARDYPVVPAIHPGAWEDFIWTKYKTIELNARNTLFIHMLCWNPVYARDVVDNMLKSIFMNDPYVHYIAMLKSVLNFPLLVPGQCRAEASFRRVQALERGVPGDQLPALCIADRAEVSPRLRVRRAVEEDNDDIVPIIERHSARLRQLYGEFYVSELISRHPESERVLLVCEHKEVAVGVMCLNTQINYEALEENFELSPFAGLRHLEKQPYYKRSKDMDSTFNLLASTTMLDQTPASMSSIEPHIQSKEMKTRVTWQFTEEEFNALRAEGKTWDHEHYGTYTQLDILNLLEDDEEELEFDIVNIDTDLLRVPRLLSHDEIVKNDTGLMDDISKVLESRKHRDSFTDSSRSAKEAKNRRLPTGISSTTPCKLIEPTRYTGSPNAFLLELFAMHQDYDERYGFDMLEASYELFPDRDYCVMCLPSSHTCFPLLEHFTLVTPFGSRLRFVNETLYVAHVNAVRGQVRVRPAEAYDTPNISEVLEHAPRKQDLLDLFESSLVSNILTSFVLLSENQPAGFVILGPLEKGKKIRNQFNLHPEPRRFGTDANILTGVMCSIMEAHGRWFLRELLRQTRYTTLFWACRLFARGDANPCRNLMSLAGHMLPVRPRQFVPNIIKNKELEQLFKEMTMPFALWSLERPLTSLPRVFINDSIVVVGAGRTGLAFLEALLTGPTAEYLTFTNITLVSEHGLPTVPECLRVADTSVPRDGRYTDRYIKSVPFYFYLDVMSGVMVKIDRKRKCIYLKGGGLKFYDELVLTCGLQFQHPDYMKESLEIVKEVEAGKPCDRILMDDPTYLPDRVLPPPDMPDNVMFINSLYDANVYLRKLLKMVSESKETSYALSKKNQIIVYGDCLEAYTCIAALLEMGLAASMITFVEPYPPEDNTLRVNLFNNETVDARVQASLNSLGVRVYRRCHFSGWRLQGSRVETIRFMDPLHAIHLSCFTLFYYGRKAIDIYSFKAINDSGLVYDGGLVVGKSFETNDPHVWGAGPCTRYSRRLHAATQIHKYYSSEDVGEALARMFLRKLDPFITESPDLDSVYSDPILHRGSSLTGMKSSRGSAGSSRLSFSTSKSRWQPVNKFNSPIFQAATLPGPLYYLRLRKPGRETPMAVELLLPHQGHTLITDKRGNYFRLQLNALHCVESVTCLSKKPFCSDIFVQLYGKHEAFFNKLLARFKMNMIDDLYQYFTKPFMSALYQESFAELLNDLHERELATVHDVVKTKFFEFHDGITDKYIPNTIPLSCLESAYCKDETKTDQQQTQNKGEYIPSECGQNERLRHDAQTFWKSVGGENIVLHNIARYFVKNSVTNPHYAVPDYDA